MTLGSTGRAAAVSDVAGRVASDAVREAVRGVCPSAEAPDSSAAAVRTGASGPGRSQVRFMGCGIELEGQLGGPLELVATGGLLET